MQGNIKNITASYQSQMDQLFAAHERQVEAAQKAFQDTVLAAEKHIQQLTGEGIVNETVANDPPLAVWTTDQSGKDVLILNREAGIMHMALLDKLQEVLAELIKLAPNRG